MIVSGCTCGAGDDALVHAIGCAGVPVVPSKKLIIPEPQVWSYQDPLLNWDDLENTGDLVWKKLELRVLIPVTSSNLLDAIVINAMSSAQLGRPTSCPQHCGKVAIDVRGFPWGRKEYLERYPKQEIYCPHCDGSEDM